MAMWSIKYSRAELYQFLHTTLRQNRPNFKYFDLANGDKILVDINTFDGSTSCHLIKDSIYKNKDTDFLLIKTRIWDSPGISNFVSNIEIYLQKVVPKKKGLIEELNSMEGDFNITDSIDFDSLCRNE